MDCGDVRRLVVVVTWEEGLSGVTLVWTARQGRFRASKRAPARCQTCSRTTRSEVLSAAPIHSRSIIHKNNREGRPFARSRLTCVQLLLSVQLYLISQSYCWRTTNRSKSSLLNQPLLSKSSASSNSAHLAVAFADASRGTTRQAARQTHQTERRSCPPHLKQRTRRAHSHTGRRLSARPHHGTSSDR